MNIYILVSAVVGVQGAFVDPPQPVTSKRSLAESETRLPCRYQVEDGEKVVQVTWFKELPDGTKDQIITAHFKDGHTGRLQRGANSDRVLYYCQPVWWSSFYSHCTEL